MTVAMHKIQDLSYGENPHQKAAFYKEALIGKGEPGIANAVQLSGKELSYNNIMDMDSAIRAACEFSEPTIAIIKHTNPCGLASHHRLAEAYRRALTGDPVSAFGGIVASNERIDEATAIEICKTHFDAMIAPGYDQEALEMLQKRNMRILTIQDIPPRHTPTLEFRRVSGSGFIVQTTDCTADDIPMKTMSKREPTKQEIADLIFAWREACQIQRHRAGEGQPAAGYGRGTAQPRGQCGHRDKEGQRSCQRQRPGLRRLLPLPRRR